MGQVSEAQDEWDTAQVAYQQSLQVRRVLEKMLGTPQAQQDVSASEENLKRLNQKRADLGEL